jgi:hypothetical protein
MYGDDVMVAVNRRSVTFRVRVHTPPEPWTTTGELLLAKKAIGTFCPL